MLYSYPQKMFDLAGKFWKNSGDMIKYYKRLLNDGCITMSMYEKKPADLDIANTDIDTSYFSKITFEKKEIIANR